jgi:hypothetical protein
MTRIAAGVATVVAVTVAVAIENPECSEKNRFIY